MLGVTGFEVGVAIDARRVPFLMREVVPVVADTTVAHFQVAARLETFRHIADPVSLIAADLDRTRAVLRKETVAARHRSLFCLSSR